MLQIAGSVVLNGKPGYKLICWPAKMEVIIVPDMAAKPNNAA